MQITYYLLESTGLWTGETTTLTQFDPVPNCSTPITPPPIPVGKFGVYRGSWSIVDEKPVPLTPVTPSGRPVIVLTEISENGVPKEFGSLTEIDVIVGQTLDFKAELRNPTSGAIIPVSDKFRMPLTAKDGREEVILATMTEGIITFRIAFRESRIWNTTQETINQNLPPERQMDFAGLLVYVLRND